MARKKNTYDRIVERLTNSNGTIDPAKLRQVTRSFSSEGQELELAKAIQRNLEARRKK